MANPHCKEFSPRQRRPRVIPSFPKDTDGRPVSAFSPPWPLNAADLISDQLYTFLKLNRQFNRLSNGFDQMIAACINCRMSVDMFNAVCLFRLRSEVCERATPARPAAQSNRRRWIQVNARRQPEKR